MFSVGRRAFSVAITEYHLGTLTNSFDLNIIFLNVIQTPIWKMLYPSNALFGLPSTYRKPSLIPVSPTKSVRKDVEVEVLPRQSDLKQPPQEITDYSHGYGFI